MSLTRKLVLAFLLVTVVPLGVIICVSHQTFVEYAQQQVGTRLEDDVVRTGRSMDVFILTCMRDMRALAADPELGSRERAVMKGTLRRFTYSFPYFDELTFVDLDGTVGVSSYTPAEGKSLFTRFDQARAKFEQALRGPPGAIYICDLDDALKGPRRVVAGGDATDATRNLQMFAPVQDVAGHCTGVLVGNVVTRPLYDSLRDLAVSALGGGSAFLLNQEARVLDDH